MSNRRASLLLSVLLFGPSATAIAQAPPAAVRVDEVRTGPLTQTVPVLGRLVARQSGTIAARIAGPVSGVAVEVGTRVAAGDLIAELNSETLRAARGVAKARLGEARARLATREAEQKLAEQTRQRLEQLRDASSKSLFEDARQSVAIAAARVQEARAGLQSAKAALHTAELDLTYARVTAPYAGVVIERMVEIGNYVQAGQALVELVSDQSLEVEADVPFNRLGGLQPGASVGLQLDDDSKGHRALVRAVVPIENARTRTRRVRFTPEFGTTRQPLAVAQSVTLQLPTGAARDILTVHKDAINRRGGASTVFVIVEKTSDGNKTLVAQARPVRLGEPSGNRFEVLGGLKAGDRVVVRGNERLRPDSPVRVDTSGS